MTELHQVSIATTGNVYFDGRCVSWTLHTADGERKSVGVIRPGELTFTTAAPEVMDVHQGLCRVRLAGTEEWIDHGPGDSFEVAGDSSFDIDVVETLHYVCHYG